MTWLREFWLEADRLDGNLGGLRRALGVARGDEGGRRCSVGQLTLLTFGGAAALLITLSIILALGGGQ